MLPYQKDPSKGKPEDFGAELIYVGKLKVREFFELKKFSISLLSFTDVFTSFFSLALKLD